MIKDLEARVKKMLAAEDHPGDIEMLDLIEELWEEVLTLREELHEWQINSLQD